jgi:hypothetical protein
VSFVFESSADVQYGTDKLVEALVLGFEAEDNSESAMHKSGFIPHPVDKMMPLHTGGSVLPVSTKKDSFSQRREGVERWAGAESVGPKSIESPSPNLQLDLRSHVQMGRV